MIYDIKTNRWKRLARCPIQGTRYQHSSILYGDKLIIWGGGTSGYGKYCDGAIYDIEKDEWKEMDDAPIGPRIGHTSILYKDKLIIWGGKVAEVWRDDGAIYDIEKDEWREMAEAPIDPRGGHTSMLYGDKLIIWGGVTARLMIPLNDGAIYDIEKRQWRLMADAPLTGGWHKSLLFERE
jgi:N-acetylneuraminic acid mutarotase